MIVCANCKHLNLTGTLFCAECGTQLVGRDDISTQIITGDDGRVESKKSTEDKYQPFNVNEAWGSLHLVDTGQVLPLSMKSEFTLGRVSEGQPIMPDIDFSPYQAYASGVSRLHAVLKRADERIIYMDLGSANGSYVNGARLSPNVEHPLNHGDMIALGKLRIQILFKK
ncbi:MAG: FHA domain-containing protein [Anaerolineales bacterium]|jgi:hypothetical protein|nr:FHA domain-containing protein [Anaerolineales bacterium]